MFTRRVSRRTFIVGSVAAGALGAWAVSRRWKRPREEELRFSVDAKLLDELEENPEFDCLVVGSGPAGCTVAGDLAARGRRVLVVESAYGPDRQRLSVSPALDRYVSEGPLDYPLAASRTRAIGGTSAIWTGRCPRLLIEDFAASPYARAMGGWPLSYADLEDYYRQAEDSLVVINRSQGPGEGVPAEPVAPTSLSRILLGAGVVVAPPPVSAGSAGGSQLRYGPDRWPSLAQLPVVTLVDGASTTRIHTTQQGDVESLEIRSLDGAVRRVRAAAYVVAAGTLESVKLLAISAAAAHPEGIGNRSGLLGVGFGEHPWLRFKGRVPEFSKSPRSGLFRTTQFAAANHAEGLGGTNLAFYHSTDNSEAVRLACSIEMEPSRENHLSLHPAITDGLGNPGLGLRFQFTDVDRRTMARSEERLREIAAKVGIVSFEADAPALAWSHHHIGGCRMSAAPGNGVVDPDLRVHGTSNLYLVSSATFVTGGVANPTLTIVALAHRLAEHLAG